LGAPFDVASWLSLSCTNSAAEFVPACIIDVTSGWGVMLGVQTIQAGDTVWPAENSAVNPHLRPVFSGSDSDVELDSNTNSVSPT